MRDYNSRYSSFPTEVLCLKNFSASEIQLNGVSVDKFVSDMEVANKLKELKLVFITELKIVVPRSICSTFFWEIITINRNSLIKNYFYF